MQEKSTTPEIFFCDAEVAFSRPVKESEFSANKKKVNDFVAEKPGRRRG